MYTKMTFPGSFIPLLAVGVVTIAFPAASFQTQVTLWSVFDGTAKVCEQSNNPVFTESTAPGSGNPAWTWQVSNIRGFTGGADFSFVILNTDGTQAALHWTAVENSDWQESGGCEGLFDLRLTNGIDPDIIYPDFQVSLRYLALNGYTVFQGQTGGGSALPVGDPHTYTFSIPAFSVELPADLSMTMNNVGAVTEVSGTIVGNEEGTFTVRISDGSRPYSDLNGIPLSLRRLGVDGYTVFQGQTGGGSALPVGDPHTYTFSIPAFSAELPADLSMTMNNVGAVTGVDSSGATWNEEGTFTVRISDGSRPYSEIAGMPLSLRRLGVDGYTVFQGQTGGGSALPVGDPHTYTFSIPAFSAELPADLSMTMNNVGAVTGVDSSGATWNEEGTFTVRISDGSRPYSEIAGMPLSLRRLGVDGYTVFQGQTGGGSALPVGDPHTYTFSIPAFSAELPADLSMTMNNVGAVTGVDSSGATWNEEGTFTVRISDGSRPYSEINGVSLSLRRVVPDTLTIPNSGGAGNISLQVFGDPGPWDWFDYEDGLANSVLMAPDALDASALTISWAADALESGEMGTGVVTIQRSDDSAPSSIVALDTIVTAAPPVPLSCWPVLAAMLAVAGIVLVDRRRHGTTR